MKIINNSINMNNLEDALDFPSFEKIHLFDKEKPKKGSGVKHNLNHHSTMSRLYIKEKKEAKEKRINNMLSYNSFGGLPKESNYLY